MNYDCHKLNFQVNLAVGPSNKQKPTIADIEFRSPDLHLHAHHPELKAEIIVGENLKDQKGYPVTVSLDADQCGVLGNYLSRYSRIISFNEMHRMKQQIEELVKETND